MAKQILKIILSFRAAAMSLLCGLNAEKLFVKNPGLVTIPVPGREIEPYHHRWLYSVRDFEMGREF